MRILNIFAFLLLAIPAAFAQQEPTFGQKLDDLLGKGQDLAGDVFELGGDILGENHPYSRYCIVPPVASPDLCELLGRNGYVLLDTTIGRLGTRLAEAADRGETKQLKDDAQLLITRWQTPDVMDIQEQRSTNSIWSVFDRKGYFNLFGTNFGALLETSFALQLKLCGEGNTAACSLSDNARKALADALPLVESFSPQEADLWNWFRARYNLVDEPPPQSF